VDRDGTATPFEKGFHRPSNEDTRLGQRAGVVLEQPRPVPRRWPSTTRTKWTSGRARRTVIPGMPRGTGESKPQRGACGLIPTRACWLSSGILQRGGPAMCAAGRPPTSATTADRLARRAPDSVSDGWLAGLDLGPSFRTSQAAARAVPEVPVSVTRGPVAGPARRRVPAARLRLRRRDDQLRAAARREAGRPARPAPCPSR